MNRGKCDPQSIQLADGTADCSRYVEEFQIDEHLLVALPQPVNECKRIATHKELQTDLVENDAVIQNSYQFFRSRYRGHIERHDQSIIGRNYGLQGHRSNLATTGNCDPLERYPLPALRHVPR